MTDAAIASIGRNLAAALARRARERDSESTKEVARLQTELCAAWRQEEVDDSGSPNTTDHDQDAPAGPSGL